MNPASFLEVPNYQIICDVKSWNKYTIGFIGINVWFLQIYEKERKSATARFFILHFSFFI